MNNYKNPFYTAYTHAQDLYGAEISSDDFETIGLNAWDKIGNKDYKLYLYTAEPLLISENEWILDLPCNADEIEAVTTGFEDFQKTSNSLNYTDTYKGYIEGYIENRKYNTNPLYISGKYVKYRKEDNRLIFNYKYPIINVLYKGYVADDEGLPFLTNKEVDAIALYCVYITDLKEARISKDKSTMEIAMYMKQEWLKACTQARIPDYINQNEMDEILNVASSWDRKRFGKSFKPLR